VISFSVSQRTHEIGIRMALGAGSRNVLRMVLQQGALIVGAGLGLGIMGYGNGAAGWGLFEWG
jgi:putative ABC transport system permease protein